MWPGLECRRVLFRSTLQVLVPRLLDQIGEAAPRAPPVDEDGHVAVREVGIPWKDAPDLVGVEDTQDTGTGRSLGGRQSRHVPGAPLPLDAVEERPQADPFGGDGRDGSMLAP